ncbi:P-loop containing nucleoside triphosphate hydrolase protein [Trichoderma chlorosporum]
MVSLSYLTRRLAIGAPRIFPSVKLPASDIYNSASSITPSRRLFQQKATKPSFLPSPEQQNVVKLCAEQNIVISARPGSGKTATAEAIVAEYPYLRTGAFVYTKALQLENERRFEGYPNFKAYTMHKMVQLLSGVVMPDDAALFKQIKRVMESNELPRGNFEPFDIIVLDEFQDCTEHLYWATICFLRVNTRKRGGQPARLVILGDERQSIYRFRGADHRYLTLAPELLGPTNSSSFVNLPLSESFRLSKETVNFINQTFLGGESYITSSKSGPKPIVVRYDSHNPRYSHTLAKKLSALIKQYGAENTAIISPSIRKNGNVIKLANILAEEYHIPIAQPIDNDGPLDKRIFDGKLCISTIHGFKGRERDLVILLNIDSSFFEYLGRDLPDNTCPNEVFVALTRATEQLVMVHNEQKKVMPFVSVGNLYETADVVNLTRRKAKIAPPNAPGRALQFGLVLPSKVKVTEMARYIRGERLDEVVQRELCIRELSASLPKQEYIRMLDVVCSDTKGGFYEAVGDINSLVVLAAFQYALTGTTTMFNFLNPDIKDRFPACPEEQVSWLCRQACNYQARVSGYLPRLLQMQNHDFKWIELKQLVLARNRLQNELRDSTSNLKFKVKVERYLVVDKQETLLRGRADVITVPITSDNGDNEGVESLWEIQFVPRLNNEHIVHACTYAYLLASQSGRLPHIILYNVRDGMKLEITPRDGIEGLRRMIESVLRLKYTAEKGMEDDAFSEMCARTRREVMNLDDFTCQEDIEA